MTKPKPTEQHINLNISRVLWRKFTLKVIEKHGTRKNSEVIIKMIEGYVNRSR
jgi:hypothetical protein